MTTIFRKQLDMSTPAAGASTVVLNRSSLGASINADLGAVQLTVGGLDGGTWQVEGLFGDGVWRLLPSATSLAAAALFLVSEDWVVEQLRVTTAAMGVSASRYVYVAEQGRKVRAAVTLAGDPELSMP